MSAMFSFSRLVLQPSHGGYPGEITVQDEYLECPACGWAYPLDQGDTYCEECEVEALLEVRRAHPAPLSTLALFHGMNGDAS